MLQAGTSATCIRHSGSGQMLKLLTIGILVLASGCSQQLKPVNDTARQAARDHWTATEVLYCCANSTGELQRKADAVQAEFLEYCEGKCGD